MTDTLSHNLTFGAPRNVAYDTNDDSPTKGGWINAEVPVSLDGAPYGVAYIGAWVYTDHDLAPTQDANDECERTGYAFRSYRGHDRRWSYEREDLVDAEDIFPDADAAEQALLDAADDAADIDYDEIFRDVLRKHLADKLDDASTYDLIRAIRALDGE